MDEFEITWNGIVFLLEVDLSKNLDSISYSDIRIVSPYGDACGNDFEVKWLSEEAKKAIKQEGLKEFLVNYPGEYF